MWIEKIGIENFRNFEYQCMDFSDGVNIIYGDNAQGKTNIMEALWLFTGFHSFRTRKNSELIRFNQPAARLKIKFHDSYGENVAEIFIDHKGKKVILNGEEIAPRGDLLGKVQAVLFSPLTMNLITGGPAERRKFIDIAMSALYPKYSYNLIRYNTILKQRNMYLKIYYKSPKDTDILLDYYDKELAATGAELIMQREEYIAKLKLYSADAYELISDQKEDFKMHYITPVCAVPDDLESVKKIFIEKLTQTRKSDVERETTQIGPHRDDLVFYLDSKPAKVFASQGQRRSCALAIKFAEAFIANFETKEVPIIMLDDVMSELDQKRQHDLFKNLNESQTFITCCDKGQVKRFTKGKYFEIKNGEIYY